MHRRPLVETFSVVSLAILLAQCGPSARKASDARSVPNLGGIDGGVAGHDGGSSTRPNILFIMSDDHACAGHQLLWEPAQPDAATSTGSPRTAMRFDNCFCTNAICAPSRAGILTGKYSHINGVRNNSQDVRRDADDVPQSCSGGGLRDGHHRQMAPQERPDRLRLLEHPARPGGLLQPDLIEMGKRKQHPGYVTEILTDMAVEWLQDRQTRPSLSC